MVLTGESDPYKSAERFLEHGAKAVIIKCGKRGCIYKSAAEAFEVPAYQGANVIDTTGAGDSFAAGFMYGLSKGLSPKECCRYGCAVASVVVEHMGTRCSKEINNETEKRYRDLLYAE